MVKKVVLQDFTNEAIVAELTSRGYMVTAPKVPYKTVKLPYSKDSVPAVHSHLNGGKKVRINFGKFKNTWVQVTFSSIEELNSWIEANPVRKKYGKSFSLL